METKHSTLINEIANYKKQLDSIDYIHDKAKFFKLMREFVSFLTEESVHFDYDKIRNDPFLVKNRNYFIRLNLYFIRALEAHESMNILSKNATTLGVNSSLELLNAKYIKEDYIRKGNDLKNVDMVGEKTLVMVGCGPFPETILYIYENTPIKKIIGLDYSNEAIYMAGEIIRYLGFKEITLKYQDGCCYDYSGADIVYIASFVELKDEIISQIVKTGKKDVQILVREPAGLNQLRYYPMENITSDLEIVNNNESRGFFHATNMIKFQRKDRNT